MCGVFGYSGIVPPDMNKLKLLGIINEERGEHSSGYFYDGVINKGAKDEALFRHLIRKYPLKAVEGANIFIGHCRKATYGEKTEENAHPFLINNELVLVHNGTLENAWILAKKYDINANDIKVDSLVFGCLLHKQGHKILEEYKGAAAIIMTDQREADALWIYHGASRKVINGKEEEERPLYMMKTPNGIYLSSLAYSLFIIQENKEEIITQVPHNRAIKIVGNEIKEEIAINRGDINTAYVYVPPVQITGFVNTVKQFPSAKSKVVEKASKEELKPLIWKETTPNRALSTENLIFYHKSRYWEKVEFVGGDETHICHGKRILTKKGVLCLQGEGDENWFYQGAWLIHGKSDFDKLNTSEYQQKLSMLNFALILSKFSKYPITNLEEDSKDMMPNIRFLWFKEGKQEKSGFTPKFGNRTYTFKNGALNSIQCADPSESPLIEDEKSPIITPYVHSTDKDEEKEKLLDQVSKEYAFFQKKWGNSAEITMEISEVGFNALELLIKDSISILKDEEATADDVIEEMNRIFDDTVLNDNTLEENLPKTGEILIYLEDSISAQEKLLKDIKGILKNTDELKREVSDEYVLDEGSGFYLPKKLVEDADRDELPFPLDIQGKAEPCKECGGIGIVAEGKCDKCLGTGLSLKKKEDLNQGVLFDDPELVEAEEQYENSGFEEWVEDKEGDKETEKAFDIISDTVLDIMDIGDSIEDLDKLEKSKFAKDLAEVLRPFVTTVKKRITSIGWIYNFPKLVKQINQKKS